MARRTYAVLQFLPHNEGEGPVELTYALLAASGCTLAALVRAAYFRARPRRDPTGRR
jgi:hypothetical protein